MIHDEDEEQNESNYYMYSQSHDVKVDRLTVNTKYMYQYQDANR